jgi:hypothetical protein
MTSELLPLNGIVYIAVPKEGACKARITRRYGREYGCQFLEPLSQEVLYRAEVGNTPEAFGDTRPGGGETLVILATLVCISVLPWLLTGWAVYSLVAWFGAYV